MVLENYTDCDSDISATTPTTSNKARQTKVTNTHRNKKSLSEIQLQIQQIKKEEGEAEKEMFVGTIFKKTTRNNVEMHKSNVKRLERNFYWFTG